MTAYVLSSYDDLKSSTTGGVGQWETVKDRTLEFWQWLQSSEYTAKTKKKKKKTQETQHSKNAKNHLIVCKCVSELMFVYRVKTSQS